MVVHLVLSSRVVWRDSLRVREILEARGVILSYAEKLQSKSDKLKAIQNRSGSGRKKRETDNIQQSTPYFDARKAVMPMFVSGGALRVQCSSSADLQAR